MIMVFPIIYLKGFIHVTDKNFKLRITNTGVISTLDFIPPLCNNYHKQSINTSHCKQTTMTSRLNIQRKKQQQK